MVTNAFEFEWGGKTYTTLKVTPVLKGKLLRLLALTQRDVGDASEKELLQSKNLQLLVASALYEFGPGTLWDFLPKESKNQIGTLDLFIENIEITAVSAFFEWGMSYLKETDDFLDNSATAKRKPAKPNP